MRAFLTDPVIVSTFFMTFSIVSLISLIYLYVKTPKGKTFQERSINSIVYEFDKLYEEDRSTNTGLWGKWCDHWASKLKSDGSRYDNPHKAGIDVLFVIIIGFIIPALVTQNITAGIIIPVVILLIMTTIATNKRNRKLDTIRDQIPGFLISLKSYLNSGSTVENAFVQSVDGLTNPLKGELEESKERILAGYSFPETLEMLSKNTISNDISFLASCMTLSSKTGSGIVNQVDNIHRLVEDRRQLRGKIESSIKPHYNTIKTSFMVIIGVTGYVIYNDISGYYFESIYSYLSLSVIVLILFYAYKSTTKVIQKVKDLL